jgi:hypothetical protein
MAMTVGQVVIDDGRKPGISQSKARMAANVTRAPRDENNITHVIHAFC